MTPTTRLTHISTTSQSQHISRDSASSSQQSNTKQQRSKKLKITDPTAINAPILSRKDLESLKKQVRTASIDISEIAKARSTLIHNKVYRSTVRSLFERMRKSVQASTTLTQEDRELYTKAINQSGIEARKFVSTPKKHSPYIKTILTQMQAATLPLSEIHRAFIALKKEYSESVPYSHMSRFKHKLLEKATTEQEKQKIIFCFAFLKKAPRDPSESVQKAHAKKYEIKNQMLSCNFSPKEAPELIRQLIKLGLSTNTIKSWTSKTRKNINAKNWTPEQKEIMSRSLYIGKYESLITKQEGLKLNISAENIEHVKSQIKQGHILKHQLAQYRVQLNALGQTKCQITYIFSCCKKSIIDSNRSDTEKAELISEVNRSAKIAAQIIQRLSNKTIKSKSTIKMKKKQQSLLRKPLTDIKTSTLIQLIKNGQLESNMLEQTVKQLSQKIPTEELLQSLLLYEIQHQYTEKDISVHLMKAKQLISEHQEYLHDLGVVKAPCLSLFDEPSTSEPTLTEDRLLSSLYDTDQSTTIQTTELTLNQYTLSNIFAPTSLVQEQEIIDLQQIESGKLDPRLLVKSVKLLLNTTSSQNQLLQALSLYEINHSYEHEEVSINLALAEKIIQSHKL